MFSIAAVKGPNVQSGTDSTGRVMSLADGGVMRWIAFLLVHITVAPSTHWRLRAPESDVTSAAE